MKFEWIENPHAIASPKHIEIFNEGNICTKLLIENNQKNICHLSSQLLWKLKELLKAFAMSEKGEKFIKRIDASSYHVSSFFFYIIILLCFVFIDRLLALVGGK